MTPTIENGVVTTFEFLADNVTDLSPVRALGSLRHLDVHGGSTGQGKLVNLSPLAGMTLTSLHIYSTRVSDLSPLQGMKLTGFHCSGTLVADPSPLKGMPLAFLNAGGTRISDFSLLQDMPLTEIKLDSTRLSDLSPLRGKPLTALWCATGRIVDHSCLREMPLKELDLTFRPERDTELLRSIKTLEWVNQKPVAEFWKDVETQASGK